MGSYMWRDDDIANVLAGLGAVSAQHAALSHDEISAAYGRGFRDALLAAAASFGVSKRAFGPESNWPPVTVIENE